MCVVSLNTYEHYILFVKFVKKGEKSGEAPLPIRAAARLPIIAPVGRLILYKY